MTALRALTANKGIEYHRYLFLNSSFMFSVTFAFFIRNAANAPVIEQKIIAPIAHSGVFIVLSS